MFNFLNPSEKEKKFMRTNRKLVSLVLVVFLLSAVSSVGAQPTEPYPIGEVTIEATSLAAGVGFSWGDGTLKFKGKEYKFSIRGLNVATVGIAKIKAVGDVYNMENVADFAGTYGAVEGGLTLAKGVAGLLMRNTKGVVINLRATQQGVNITLGVEGFTVALK
jgi:hypothetical protein